MKRRTLFLPQLFTGFLLALLASTFSQTLFAQQSDPGTFYLFLWPEMEATGRIYFSGDEARALSNPQTSSLAGNQATGKIGNSLKSASLKMGFYAYYEDRNENEIGGLGV